MYNIYILKSLNATVLFVVELFSYIILDKS